MKTPIWSLALLSGLVIWYCHELWCRWQIQLGSLIAVAVAQASSCSFHSTPSLGTSMCHRYGARKQKKKKKKLAHIIVNIVKSQIFKVHRTTRVCVCVCVCVKKPSMSGINFFRFILFEVQWIFYQLEVEKFVFNWFVGIQGSLPPSGGEI